MPIFRQSVDKFDYDQFKLYSRLVCEEYNEFIDAIDGHAKFAENFDKTEQSFRQEIVDALCDMIVVCAGALHSLGVDVNGSWNEVINSNLSKIDKNTGKVIKRSDGKVLKPEGWTPPDLSKFVFPKDQNK